MDINKQLLDKKSLQWAHISILRDKLSLLRDKKGLL